MTTSAAALRAVEPALAAMPAPTDTSHSQALERELAMRFDVRHAVSVSSGTAALHTALAAVGVGRGDEVLVPAATVPMTVAAITATGAHPVFVDSPPSGLGMDAGDAAAKAGRRTRAIVCVHLFGRTDDVDGVLDLADHVGVPLIEDACQAQGSRHHGRHAGTLGTIGCFSLKDGKIVACGEGGYLLTNNSELAERAAAWRNHGLSAAPGTPAGTSLGHNFRLAQPLAALAAHHLATFDTAMRRRRSQHDSLVERLAATPGLTTVPEQHRSNGYSPLWRLTLPNPRGFTQRLAELGIVNSSGSFGLRAAPEQPWCAELNPAPCPHAAAALETLLAVVLTAAQTDSDLAIIGDTIDREARTWH